MRLVASEIVQPLSPHKNSHHWNNPFSQQIEHRMTTYTQTNNRFTDILAPMQHCVGFLGVEWATFAYSLLTTVLIFCFSTRLSDPAAMLHSRLYIILGVAVCVALYRWRPCRLTLFVRRLFPLTLLNVWYPETYEFCRLFPYWDHLFAGADQLLFGCQPSLVFSQVFSSVWWSEAFHLGYFSYYPMILFTVLVPLFCCRDRFDRTSFVVLSSFFLYYLIYLFLPVGGPQYYFCAIGEGQAASGIFPEIGNYLAAHLEMRPSPGADGLFRDLVVMAQHAGERPTAAFPSSHVGISTILLLLMWHLRRRLVLCLAPFYVLLCCATVYIEAHYLVDVLAGWVSAVLFYLLTTRLYDFINRRGWVMNNASGV